MSPVPVSAYPYGPPTVNATTGTTTVSLFLQSPPRVQRAIEGLARQRFVADVVFGDGPTATGGAVLYDQLLAGDPSVLSGGDVQEIEPGMEFPVIGDTDVTPLVAIAKKWGGEVFLTDEAVRRDNRGLLNRQMTRLRNTIIKKVDTVAMAVLRAAPTLTMPASGDWSTAATDILRDLANARFLSESLDMGYELDTVLLNPAQALDLVSDADLRAALPRERDDSIIRTGNIGRLVGLDFIQSNRVNPGEVFVLQRKMVGSISDEVPLYARPIPEPRREAVFLHGARVAVPYVTDPKAAVRITGA